MHLTLPIRVEPTLLLDVLDHLWHQPTPISSYLFLLISSLPFTQASGSKTHISRSIELFLQFLMLNLKLSLWLLFAIADFKEDCSIHFLIIIADRLTVSLNLQFSFPLYQFLFPVSAVLFPTKWFSIIVFGFQLQSFSNLLPTFLNVWLYPLAISQAAFIPILISIAFILFLFLVNWIKQAQVRIPLTNDKNIKLSNLLSFSSYSLIDWMIYCSSIYNSSFDLSRASYSLTFS